MAAPLSFILILLTKGLHTFLFWTITTFAITFLCLSWTIVTNIVIYVVEPTKRSFALSINVMISCLLGDSLSPYVIGVISDLLKKTTQHDDFDRFSSLQTSLYLVPIMTLISSLCYFTASIYLVDDKNRAECIILSNLVLYKYLKN